MARLLVLAAVAAVAVANPLGPYNIDPSRVTAGGLSAGAFMTVQYHFAFSSEVSGAAVFAGGPFYCSQDSETTALTSCMNGLPSLPSASSLLSAAKQAASSGEIDDMSDLAHANVFLYSGTGDTVVKSAVVKVAEELYKEVVTSGNVTSEFSINSEHCMPTTDYGNSCSTLGSPYINNCNYDGAGVALQTMYGTLAGGRGTMVDANLMEFDQTQFGASSSISMNDKGYIYVPTACQKNATCSLHIQFHGCSQCESDVQDTYARHAGYNQWAEANNIVVIYPQAAHSYVYPSNPQGCFDWWGYTGSDYAFKSGKQMTVVHKIQQAVMGH